MRFNKLGVPDPTGRYEKDSDGRWWYHYGKTHPVRTVAKLLPCMECGKQFLEMPNRGAANLNRFCSRTCSGISITKRGLCPIARKGKKNPNWQGGVIIRRGYAYVHKPEHPSLVGTKGKYVRRCRLVMEKRMGRLLARRENVHHKNGITDDDRPSNLELWATAQPAGVRDHYCPNCSCAKCIALRASGAVRGMRPRRRQPALSK